MSITEWLPYISANKTMWKNGNYPVGCAKSLQAVTSANCRKDYVDVQHYV